MYQGYFLKINFFSNFQVRLIEPSNSNNFVQLIALDNLTLC